MLRCRFALLSRQVVSFVKPSNLIDSFDSSGGGCCELGYVLVSRFLDVVAFIFLLAIIVSKSCQPAKEAAAPSGRLVLVAEAMEEARV